MNRNIFAYLLLFATFTQLMHMLYDYAYILAFIMFAIISMCIVIVVGPPLKMLMKGQVINQNYDDANILIVVSIVSSIVLLGFGFYIKYGDTELLTTSNVLLLLTIFFAVDIIAFHQDFDQKWVYIAIIGHVLVMIYIDFLSKRYWDVFFMQIAFYYIIMHMIFVISYFVLRYITQFNFPQKKKYTV